MTELLLESRSEWEFYETLRTWGANFRLRVDRQPSGIAGQDGRAWFVLDGSWSVRWAAAKGWEVRKDGQLWYSANPWELAAKLSTAKILQQ